MPSDPRTRPVLDTVAPATRAFHDMVKTAIEEIHQHVGTLRATSEERLERLTAELGPFARRHVNAGRLMPLLGEQESADQETVDTVERALTTLRDLVALGEELHVVTVPAGWSVRDAVDETLARVGRAFGAARLVAAIKTGNYRFGDHARSLGSFPFSRWTRAERLLAPPLVLEVAGTDLGAAALADFLDGRLKIVLVVTGACSPAPLVRLITPGIFVQQAQDATELKRFAAWTGPGIAALVPEDTAQFVHDPAIAPATGSRLTLGRVPDGRRRPVGGLSVTQQAEELKLLATIAQASAPAPAAAAAKAPAAGTNGTPADSADPADKLAAWLLSQADLRELG